MKYVLIVINAFLLGACMFSISQYAASINEKYSLIDSIENGKMRITAVSKERQNLLQTLEKEKEINKQAAQKNLLLKNNLNASVKKIGKPFTKFVEINNEMDELMLRMSILKQENKAIREEENKLKFDLGILSKISNLMPALIL